MDEGGARQDRRRDRGGADDGGGSRDGPHDCTGVFPEPVSQQELQGEAQHPPQGRPQGEPPEGDRSRETCEEHEGTPHPNGQPGDKAYPVPASRQPPVHPAGSRWGNKGGAFAFAFAGAGAGAGAFAFAGAFAGAGACNGQGGQGRPGVVAAPRRKEGTHPPPDGIHDAHPEAPPDEEGDRVAENDPGVEAEDEGGPPLGREGGRGRPREDAERVLRHGQAESRGQQQDQVGGRGGAEGGVGDCRQDRGGVGQGGQGEIGGGRGQDF